MQWPLSQRTPSSQIREDSLRYPSSYLTEKIGPQSLRLRPHHPESGCIIIIMVKKKQI